ncbi:hypothetical protein MBLNU230_g2362t1 [Neophaeotheca triangularis]
MSSSQTRSTSGVRGLKALFEKPSDDLEANPISSPSPSLRGRSPFGQRSDSHNSNSERPSSKIRASFVSVEHPGRQQLLSPSKPPQQQQQQQQQQQAGAEMEDDEGQLQPDHRRGSSVRRGSFSFTDEGSQAIADLRKTISNEEERRANESSVAETIPEAAVEATPLPNLAPKAREDIAAGIMTPRPGQETDMNREIDPMAAHAASRLKHMNVAEQQGSPGSRSPAAAARTPKAATPKSETPGKVMLPEETSVDTRDKFDAADEEEPGEMKPAEPADENAVSGGEALPPVAEDLRHGETTQNGEQQKASPGKTPGKTPPATGKLDAQPTPSPGSSKPTPRRSMNSLKSPSSTDQPPKSPLSTRSQAENKAPSPSLPKKASRSSLTAPTAASNARAASSGDLKKPAKSTTTTTSNISSRLTAPTAASKAKHDSQQPTTNGTSKPSTSTRAPSKQSASSSSSRPNPRSSMPRPESRTNHVTNTRRAAAPSSNTSGESFLERMTRPTAASANKAHDKSDKAELRSLPHSHRTGGAAVGAKKDVVNARQKAGLGVPTKKSSTTGSRPGTAKSEKLETSVTEEAQAVAKGGEARVEESAGVNAGNDRAEREVVEAEAGEAEGLGEEVAG